jgi:hypothetical protein
MTSRRPEPLITVFTSCPATSECAAAIEAEQIGDFTTANRTVLDVPTTATLTLGAIWVANARFGTRAHDGDGIVPRVDDHERAASSDQRMTRWAADGESEVPPSVARDPDILGWWTAAHDELIAAGIEREQWSWILHPGAVAAITPPEVLKAWRERHEARSHISWYGYLGWFARGRAADLGLLDSVREPEAGEC